MRQPVVRRRQGARPDPSLFALAALVPALLDGCIRGGQCKRATFGIPAYGPPIARVDDGAAKLADTVERCGQVGDGEVWKGGGIPGTRSTLVDAEAQVVGLGLPPRSGRVGPWREGDPEDSAPEPQGTFGIVGREFDEWGGHARKYDQQFAPASVAHPLLRSGPARL
jgi:hypothetical protein